MRKFKNIDKNSNNGLTERFSFLLKFNEDCTTNDCCWAAITIFDHWLYESDSMSLIEDADKQQKKSWDEQIKRFLRALVSCEEPIRYKYCGKNTKQSLQFSRYIGQQAIDDYVSQLFDDVYQTNLVFPKLGLDLWFEDNWTIHFRYKHQNDSLDMFKLAGEHGLFVLPAYSADHLNDYKTLSGFLTENGLGHTLHRDFQRN